MLDDAGVFTATEWEGFKGLRVILICPIIGLLTYGVANNIVEVVHVNPFIGTMHVVVPDWH